MSDLDYLKAKCDQFGNYFFTPGAMRFFNSRIGKVLRIDENTYRMVTSERMDMDSPRLYTVREFTVLSDSVRDTVIGEFQQYTSTREANKHIKDGI